MDVNLPRATLMRRGAWWGLLLVSLLYAWYAGDTAKAELLHQLARLGLAFHRNAHGAQLNLMSYEAFESGSAH